MIRSTYESVKKKVLMSDSSVLNILAILLIDFSPLVIGFTVLFYIKNKQTQETPIKNRNYLESVFGL